MKLHSFCLVASLALFVSCNRPTITEYTLEVAPQTKKCVYGFGAPRDPNPDSPSTMMDCIQVRKDSSQPYAHSFDIKGFTFQPGFTYRLRVRSVVPNSGLMDDFGYVELINVVEKTPASN